MSSLIGMSVGRYHIVEKLGQGGMATVYKAFDTRLERYVAIKFIRAEAVKEEVFLKRFEREAKALAQLSHPNIVKVHDYGNYEGSPYLVMEYVAGGTLKQHLGKPLPWKNAARLILPICHTLDYTHQRGIIHRDIKPSNFLISESDQPMLSDFGIAKLLESSETVNLTGTGVGIGTPEYMAPEQGMGNPIDQRADIYSLGVVFYELLTGRKPFSADTPMAILLKHVSDPLPSPRSMAVDLPDQVEKIVIKALAKKPEDRYQTMGEFAKALESILAGEAFENEPETLQMNNSQQPDRTVGPPIQVHGETRAAGRARIQQPQQQPLKQKPEKKKSNIWLPIILIAGFFGCIILVAGGYFGYNYLQEQEKKNQTATAVSIENTREARDEERTQEAADRQETQAQEALYAAQTIEAEQTATQIAYEQNMEATNIAFQQTQTQESIYASETENAGPSWYTDLYHDFSTPEDWYEGDYSSDYWVGTKEVSNGKLIWSMDVINDVYHYEEANSTYYSDFYVGVTAEQVSGGPSGKYGFVLRKQEDTRYYFFVNPNSQTFMFFLLDNTSENRWTTFADQYSSAISPSGANNLEVEMLGGDIYLYINGEQVFQTYDSTISYGYIGLAAGLDGGESGIFQFDDLEIAVYE